MARYATSGCVRIATHGEELEVNRGLTALEKRGVASATSVGFIVKNWKGADNEQRKAD